MQSDERLVNKAVSGDSRAFGKLLSRYQEQILFLLYDIFGDYDQANQVAQKVFHIAAEKLHTFKDKTSFSSWLYRVAINTSLKIQNKHQRGKREAVETKLPLQQFKRPITDVTKKSELDDAVIQSLLLRLTPQQRITIILRYFHKRSIREIVDIMQWREDTVRLHIKRAVDKFRIAFEEQKSQKDVN